MAAYELHCIIFREVNPYNFILPIGSNDELFTLYLVCTLPLLLCWACLSGINPRCHSTIYSTGEADPRFCPA